MNGALRDLGEFVRRHEGGGRTDGQLLESFLSRRDESAFSMLVRRHGPMVLGVCRRVLGQEQDAEDAFQATFLVLARKAAGIVPREAVGAWLYGVAYRTARKAQTMTARRRLKEQQARDARRTAASPEDTWEELQPALDEELNRLPEKYRSAIVLCDLQGHTKKEAAARLRCPEGTLSSRLTRGRRLLAERLTRRGVTLPTGALAVVLSRGAASVRAGLMISTGRAAALLATGPAVGAVSARIAALTDAVLKAMLLSKLKFAVAVLAVAGILGATAAFLAPPTQAAGPVGAKAGKVAPDAKPAAPTLTDRHGDPLPAGAVARLGTVRLRHKNTNGQTFVFSPDSKTLFTGGNDGKIRLWDVATGKPVRTFERRGADWGEFDTPNALALSPAGKLLAAAWGRGLHLWDVETGKEVGALREPVYSLAFTPDGRTLFCGGDGVIRVWDVAARKERTRVLWQKGAINHLVCLPDGRTLVATAFSGLGGLTLQIGDPLTDGKRGSFVRGRYPPLSFSPDGKVLAVEGIRPASVRLLDVMTGNELSRFTGHRNGVLGVALSPDGKTVASVGFDETIRWWDRASGKEIRKATWREPPAYPLGTRIRLAFSPDGKTLVSAGGDSTLRLWDVATGTQRQGPEGHEGGIESVVASPDGRMLVSCSFDDHTARLWDLVTGRPLHLLRHPAYVRRAVFSPDGKQVISGSGEGAIRVWDAATGKEVRILRLADPARVEGRQQVSNLTLAADGKRVIVVSAGFTPKETGQSYRLTTWDWATGERLNQRELPDGFDDAFSGDGSLVAGMAGLEIIVKNGGTGKVALRLNVPEGANNFWYPLVFSPSRRLLATVTVTRSRDGKGRRSAFTVRVWELASGREVWSRQTPCWGRVMAFSPDGKRLAWAGADIFAVHDAATGRELLRREGFDGSVYALTFLPDGTRLATGLDNGTVLVWDVSRAAADPGP